MANRIASFNSKDEGETTTEEVKFTIEGNPGQGNTFIHIGTAINVNPNAKSVASTVNINERGEMKIEDNKFRQSSMRELLQQGCIDTSGVRTEIMSYVSKVRPLIEDERKNVFMHLWEGIVDLDILSVDLYDPGKQKSNFNRNLVAGIIHYLDGKGFYKDEYNASSLARYLEGDDQHPVRKALGTDLDKEYCEAIDRLIKTGIDRS